MTWISEQAADASFYELTMPKHWQTCNSVILGVGLSVVLRCTRAYTAESAHTFKVCIVK